MKDSFEPDELLFRSIPSQPSFWKDSGELSSAAFKDDRGASVDRQGGRTIDEAATVLRNKKHGRVVYVSVSNCTDCGAIVRYLPVADDKWHSEIHQSEVVVKLSRSQLKHLASAAVLIG